MTTPTHAALQGESVHQVKSSGRAWPIEQAVTLACLMEASSPKLGNVYPGFDFKDMTFVDFTFSSLAIAPVFARASELTVGELALEAVRATRTRVNVNTNLGTVLLLAPLVRAAASVHSPLDVGTLQQLTRQTLSRLTPRDCELVYEAIRHASPGGLGSQSENDVRAVPPRDLINAMRQVADVDAVARQYTNNFGDIFDRLVPLLQSLVEDHQDLREVVTWLQLRWLATEPDGLIVRKSGLAAAEEVQRRTRVLLDELAVKTAQGAVSLDCRWQALDKYLRSDGHCLNPGTTADLIAATLFVHFVTSPTPTALA